VRKFIVALLLLSLVGCSPQVRVAGAPTSTWVSPGKVFISNYYPGARAEYEITIHNGEDVDSGFEIAYKVPDYTDAGYAKATEELGRYVSVGDKVVTLRPDEIRKVLVVLEVPKGIEVPWGKWEFWVSVNGEPQGSGGLGIAVGYATRWLVTMR